jgi:hypothetical protein
LDLTSDHPRLTMIPGTVAMRNIALNPALASAMGESLGNILFAGASSASGQATLTINQCNRLPLDNLVSQRTLENDGMLDMAASVSDVELGSPNINKAASGLSSALQLVNARIDPGFVKSLRGSIKNYTIKIQKGVTTHDMLMSFTESDRPLHLTGTMGLEKKDLNMALELPWALLGMNDKVVTGAMPGGIQIPVSGTATAPRFNVNEVIQKNLLQKGPQNILKNLPGLFNRDKGNQGQ